MTNKIDLLIELTRRKLIDAYVGSSLKFLWIFFVPLVPILTNLLVFFVIAKIPAVHEMGVWGYSVFILTGYLPFHFLQRSLRDSSGLLIANMDLLKSVPFSLNHLGIPSLGVLLFDFLLQLLALILLKLLSGVPFSWTILLLPFALILLVVTAIGMGWLISILGYLSSDIQQLIDLLFLGLLYLTPAVYPISSLPAQLQTVVQFNPLTHLIVVFRDVLGPPTDLHIESWGILFAMASASWTLGYFCITKAQKFVGDMV